jgi:polyhydroxybutyrate depolymerase
MTKKLIIISILLISLLACKKTNRDLFDDNNVRRIKHNGITREYILYIPESYDGSTKVPLMFNFHGYAGKAVWYMEDADMRYLSESENFILVYPQGTRDTQGNPFSTHWNAGLDTPDNKSEADDLGFIETLINEIALDYNIDKERVYACGYSNGGMFAYALAAYKSDLIAAVGSVSGTMLTETINNASPSHPTPIIHIHGTSDEVLPHTGGDGFGSVESILNYWIDFNNTDTTTVNTSGNIEHYIYEGGDNGTAVEYYKVNGGNHIWFDINYQGSNTSGLVWNFVSKYDIHGLR